MEVSEAAIRHAVSFSPLHIHHSVHVSPSTVSLIKEFRYCVIAVVLGFVATSIVKGVQRDSRDRK